MGKYSGNVIIKLNNNNNNNDNINNKGAQEAPSYELNSVKVSVC